MLLASVQLAAALPERLLTGYSGALIGDEKDAWQDYIALLRDNGFTVADFKLTPPGFNVSDPATFATLERLTAAVLDAGLELGLYTYDQNQGKRDPQTPESLAYVGPDGQTVPTSYCLYQYDSWRHAFSRVFFLAQQSRRLPISSVKLDIEMIMNTAPCLCPACFGSFCREQGQGGDLAPATDRWPWVLAHGGEQAYEAHLERRMEAVAGEFAAAVHALNPRLSLGFMPYGDDFFRRPWVRRLGTAQAPAIVDAWPLYTGQGYGPEVDREAERVHALSPHVRYVPWFRINMYTPSDLGAQAEVAGCRADGYNLWTIRMIHPQARREQMGDMYGLPVGHENPADYWAALKTANERIAQWLGGPRPVVALRSMEPLGLAPDLTKVRLTAVRALHLPARETPAATVPTGLRGRNTVVLAVEDATQPIVIRVRHLAAEQRPSPVTYALVTTEGRPVHEGKVSAGKPEELSLKVPEPGTYGLLLAARDAGPWYDVQVLSHPYAVLAGTDGVSEAYYFRQFPRQYFLVPAGTRSFTVTFAVGHSQEALLQVWDTAGKLVVQETVNADQQARRAIEIAVPPGQDGHAWSLHVGPPPQMAAQHWSENYFLRLDGVPPYLSDRPGALVAPSLIPNP
jgi:hypothetical protein